mgnify:CR=1 FL=1
MQSAGCRKRRSPLIGRSVAHSHPRSPIRIIVARHQRSHSGAILFCRKNMRCNAKKLNKTDYRAEHDAADQAPRRAAKQQVRAPAQEQHENDRTEECDSGRIRQSASPDRFFFARRCVRDGNKIGLLTRLFVRPSVGFFRFFFVFESKSGHRFVSSAIMTVSVGDFNSYVMPRHVMRRENNAATEL